MKRCSIHIIIKKSKIKLQLNTTTHPLEWLKFLKLTIESADQGYEATGTQALPVGMQNGWITLKLIFF